MSMLTILLVLAVQLHSLARAHVPLVPKIAGFALAGVFWSQSKTSVVDHLHMYEWENEYLEVPVPPIASREPPEPPETLQASRDRDALNTLSYGGYAGAYAPHGADGHAVAYTHGAETTAPSLMGAFSALVQRVVPFEQTGSDGDRERAPKWNSRGADGQRFADTPDELAVPRRSRNREPFPDASARNREPFSDASGRDGMHHVVSLDENREEYVIPPAPVNNAEPPSTSSGPGWSYNFSWGRLFGGTPEREDRIREEDPEDQSVLYPTHAQFVNPASGSSQAHDQGFASGAGFQPQVSARSWGHDNSGEVGHHSSLTGEGLRSTSPRSQGSGREETRSSEKFGGILSVDTIQHGVVETILLLLVRLYVEKIPGRTPVGIALFYLVGVWVFIAIGMAVKPITVQSNFEDFMKTDVNSSLLQDTFTAALQARSGGARRLVEDDGARLYMQYDVFLAYQLRPDDKRPTLLMSSTLDREVIAEIQAFEEEIVQMPGWKQRCESVEEEDFQRLCLPGLSFVNYARPTLDMTAASIVPTQMNFDGQGRDAMPLETTLRLVKEHGLQSVFLPEGFDNSQVSSVSSLRSVFRFKFFCCTAMMPPADQRRIVDTTAKEWEDWVKAELLPKLRKANEDERFRFIDVYFDGTGFEEIEVLQTLFGDIWLAMGSMGFVLCYLMFHTQSLFLSLTGFLIIMMSVPLAYVVFAFIAGTSKLSVASFLSLFLVIGLGSDVVFVYTDFWRDSERLKKSVTSQMAWTTMHAGKASLATTGTTALSFFANVASTLRPLREFGFFMGLCVVYVWLLVTFIFVPICAIDQAYCRCCNLRRCFPKTETGISSWQLFFERLTGAIFKMKKTIILVSIFSWVLMLILAISMAELDTGMPQLFPEDHNQNRGREVFDRFKPSLEVLKEMVGAPALREAVCKEYEFSPTDANTCPVFWCEVQASHSWTRDVDKCQCWRKEVRPCSGKSTLMAVQRIIGIELSEDDKNGFAEHLVGASSTGISFPSSAPRNTLMQATRMAPILLQEWESGDTMMRPMSEMVSTLLRDASNEQSTCDYHEICFCGTMVCKLPGNWKRSGTVDVGIKRANYGGRSLAPHGGSSLAPYPGRFLTSIKGGKRALVNIVFGILVRDSSPLLGEPEIEARWGFYPSFSAKQPWAQRNLYSFCKDIPPALKVHEILCWIEDFRIFLDERRERFPVPPAQFDSLVLDFVEYGLTGLSSSRDFLWIKDGEVKACFVKTAVDMSENVKTSTAIDFMHVWDREIARWNTQASRYAREAWHTSTLWARAEAQEALVMSTAMTLLIVLALALMGMLVFTLDLLLSAFVIIATEGVLCCLAFFITVVMRWPLGPIEVIALIVFIGYTVTYSLHLAHIFGGDEAMREEERPELGENGSIRYQRTVFSLKAIGSAALGSACTTVGCSLFLLFCTLTIFNKLGGVVMAVTVMSILTAFGPLPAALLLFGPVNPGWMCGIPSIYILMKEAWSNIKGACRKCKSVIMRMPTSSSDAPPSSDERPNKGFTHGTAGGGIRVMEPVAQPAGMRPSFNDPQMAAAPSLRGWEEVTRHQGDSLHAASPRASPRAHTSSPRALALVNSAPSPHSAALLHAPRRLHQAQTTTTSVMQVDDVLLSEKAFDAKSFDIGEESPLEPIWARDTEHSSGRVQAVNQRSPRRMGGQAVKPPAPSPSSDLPRAKALGVGMGHQMPMRLPEPAPPSKRPPGQTAMHARHRAPSPEPRAMSPGGRPQKHVPVAPVFVS